MTIFESCNNDTCFSRHVRNKVLDARYDLLLFKFLACLLHTFKRFSVTSSCPMDDHVLKHVVYVLSKACETVALYVSACMGVIVCCCCCCLQSFVASGGTGTLSANACPASIVCCMNAFTCSPLSSFFFFFFTQQNVRFTSQ